jgi:hypothetical protein
MVNILINGRKKIQQNEKKTHEGKQKITKEKEEEEREGN